MIFDSILKFLSRDSENIQEMTDSSDNEYDRTDSEEDHPSKITDNFEDEYSSMYKSLSTVSSNLMFHIEDHLTFNVTNSVLKAIASCDYESDYKPSLTITNYTGHEAQMRYTVLSDGRENDLIKYPADDSIDSSE